MYHSEDLLILTKTYPLPSSSYREHTCVIAVNSLGQLRRLFPIPYRLLAEEQQFRRWEWISASICETSKDTRPDTYRIDIDSIIRKNKLGTTREWADRLQWVEPHLMESVTAIETRRKDTNLSIGVVRPINIELELVKEEEPEWSDVEIQHLTMAGLFDQTNVIKRPLLKKLPYKFYYNYNCLHPDGTQETNRHMITDWEIGMLYWNCVDYYQSEWEKYFRKKVQNEFSKKNLYFIMGNMYRFRDQWLIVGVIYPPATSARQYQLWKPGPNE